MRKGVDQLVYAAQTVFSQLETWWLSSRVLDSRSNGWRLKKLAGDTALCLSARHFILRLVLFQSRKTACIIRPDMTKTVD